MYLVLCQDSNFHSIKAPISQALLKKTKVEPGQEWSEFSFCSILLIAKFSIFHPTVQCALQVCDQCILWHHSSICNPYHIEFILISKSCYYVKMMNRFMFCNNWKRKLVICTHLLESCSKCNMNLRLDLKNSLLWQKAFGFLFPKPWWSTWAKKPKIIFSQVRS